MRAPLSWHPRAVHAMLFMRQRKPSIPRNGSSQKSRNAERQKSGKARREQSECSREVFLGKTSEQSHHFGSARSVNVCKPANELSSTNEKVHPLSSTSPPTKSRVLRYAHPRREREPGLCEPHAHSYKNVIQTTHASSKENPIPIANASSKSAWSSCTKGR